MIVVQIHNQEELAAQDQGAFLVWLGRQFGVNVGGRVDGEIAGRLQNGLYAKNVDATVRVAGRGRIEITVGGLKGFFGESLVASGVAGELKANGVRATVTRRS